MWMYMHVAMQDVSIEQWLALERVLDERVQDVVRRGSPVQGK